MSTEEISTAATEAPASTVSVVTSEGLDAYMAEKLDIEPYKPSEAEPVEAKAEKESTEAEPEEESEPEPPAAKPKTRLEERFHELTTKAKAAEERAATAERKAADLEAKLTPPATESEPTEPQPAAYTDAFEYARDLAKFEAAKAIKAHAEGLAKQAREQAQQAATKAFHERVSVAKTTLTDYDTVLAAATDLSVSDDIRDAIIESDVGPKVLYHLASNPDLVKELGSMSQKAALRAFGKLEAQLAEAPAAPAPAPAKPIKRPPEPVTPIQSSNGVDTHIDATGEFTGTYSQYKALRNAGKL